MKSVKLEIMYKPIEQFGKRNDVALHSLDPSYDKLLELINDALKDMFPRIVIYSNKKNFGTISNIKNGASTWCKLIRDLGEDADVRAGEVGFKHGHSDGDGFTIYFKGGSK